MALSKIFSNSFKPNLLINSSGSSFQVKKQILIFYLILVLVDISKTLSHFYHRTIKRNASSTILKIILIWSSVSAVPREATEG